MEARMENPSTLTLIVKGICLAGLLAGKLAWAVPFSEGNPELGKTLVEKNCVSCHVSRLGGDGSAMYTRNPRKINSSSALLAQIRTCNTMIGSKLFEDEELHVASYLNNTYYKFDR